MKRFHQIDGLRGVAITLVVLLHCVIEQMTNFFKQTPFSGALDLSKHFFASGVDLFFVISGIVLLRPYVRGERPFIWKKYAVRRIQRLWPPYLTALLLTGLLLLVAARWPSWFSQGSFIPFDWLVWVKQILIFNVFAPFYNVTWWSLNVEIVFYLAIPMIVILINLVKKDFQILIILLLMILAAEYAYHSKLNFIGVSVSLLTLLSLFIIYFPCFFLGVMLARKDFSVKTGYVAVILGLSFIGLAEFFHLNYHTGYGLLYFGIAIVSFDPNSAVNKFLTSYPLLWVGERSYSFFLMHYTAYYTVNYLLSFILGFNLIFYLLNSSLTIIATLFSGAMIFSLVERRFARGLLTAETWSFFPMRLSLCWTKPDQS